jgi:hypothetical protein
MENGPQKVPEAAVTPTQIARAVSLVRNAITKLLTEPQYKWVRWVALVLTLLAILMLCDPILFKSTPPPRSEPLTVEAIREPPRSEPLTVEAVREKILRVGFSGCTKEERAFVHKIYERDLAALRDILVYRYRLALARNQPRIAREIRNAHGLVINALAKLKADPDLDPTTGEIQVLIHDVLTALQR